MKEIKLYILFLFFISIYSEKINIENGEIIEFKKTTEYITYNFTMANSNEIEKLILLFKFQA